jgi:hypothetical protein
MIRAQGFFVHLRCDMGFFGDIAKLNKMDEEASKDFDPGAQTRAGTDQLKAMNKSMAAATTALTTGIPAKAQIISVGMTAGSMNADSIMPMELAAGGMGRSAGVSAGQRCPSFSQNVPPVAPRVFRMRVCR